MKNLFPIQLFASPVFPFEAGNAIFVHDAACGIPCSFTKILISEILYIERHHDKPATTIFLIGGSSVDTDASIDEIISAGPGSTLLKTRWDEAVNRDIDSVQEIALPHPLLTANFVYFST